MACSANFSFAASISFSAIPNFSAGFRMRSNVYPQSMSLATKPAERNAEHFSRERNFQQQSDHKIGERRHDHRHEHFAESQRQTRASELLSPKHSCSQRH